MYVHRDFDTEHKRSGDKETRRAQREREIEMEPLHKKARMPGSVQKYHINGD
jgi:hypothetical protein